MLPYSRSSEFHDRYMNSVIYYKNDPIWVTDVSPQGHRDDERDNQRVYLHFTTLPIDHLIVSKTHKVLTTDEHFTAIPIHVGYSNSFQRIDALSPNPVKYGVYLSRMPIRRSRQGLSAEAVVMPRSGGKTFNNLLSCPNFVSMLKQEYQTYQKVKELISGNRLEYGCFAFDPKFAVELTTLDQFVLYYKNQQVGYSLDGDTFTLSKTNQWLQQTVEEKGLKIRG